MKKLFSTLALGAAIVISSVAAFGEDVWFTWTQNPSSELISTYRIEYQKHPTVTNWTTLTTVSGATNVALVKGIQSGFVYKFRIFAVNGLGSGTEQSAIVQLPNTTPTGVQGFQQTTPR
jgi:hypothetical protein